MNGFKGFDSVERYQCVNYKGVCKKFQVVAG